MADERQPLLNSNGGAQNIERPTLISAHSITARKQDHPDYPIDHGYVAWMQVLGGFILFANSWYVAVLQDDRVLIS
jgi:hypothetical protein